MSIAAAARSLTSVIVAAALIALVILSLGASPVLVFDALWEGAFGNWLVVTDTLVKSTPLIFCGLAVAIAFSGSLWNIGADGQLMMGALLTGAIGPKVANWPHSAAILVIVAAGALGGAAWGGIAGVLRARREVNEVISTIMLNFVAAQLLSWAVHGPLIEASGSFPKSTPIAAVAQLHLYFAPARLNLGMLLGVALAAVSYVMLFRTPLGFQLRAAGRNQRASRFFSIPIARITIITMVLSGALAGVGGAVQVSAITHRLYETISPGWGYEAIAVALVARLNPLAIVPAAILFGALDNGAQAMQRSQGISPVLVQVVQALVIMLLLTFDRLASAKIGTAGFDPTISEASPTAAAEIGDA